ncbi:MAG: DUF1428 domain-containing protein [Alphaproteobacteria bacterium]|nr:MAG: DUF1428 domain-containing protein [Alphaproteobacteria bacterium]
MTYVDGYVIPVKNVNKAAYIALAEMSAPVFKEHGAIAVTECWGDDVPDGKLTSFPFAVKLEADETVVFSWILWPSRDVRDAGMKAAMEDERFKDMDPASMPFDGKRMIMGGFKAVVEA